MEADISALFLTIFRHRLFGYSDHCFVLLMGFIFLHKYNKGKQTCIVNDNTQNILHLARFNVYMHVCMYVCMHICMYVCYIKIYFIHPVTNTMLISL